MNWVLYNLVSSRTLVHTSHSPSVFRSIPCGSLCSYLRVCDCLIGLSWSQALYSTSNNKIKLKYAGGKAKQIHSRCRSINQKCPNVYRSLCLISRELCMYFLITIYSELLGFPFKIVTSQPRQETYRSKNDRS